MTGVQTCALPIYQIVPYPPGIPVLVPGQVVDAQAVAYLVRLLQTQRTIELHGLAMQEGEWHLRVLTADEQAALRPLGRERRQRPQVRQG